MPDNDMTISFSRGLDPDKFGVQFTFGPESFGRAFPPGSTDPDDVFFRLMGSNLASVSIESVARLVADFAKIVQAALDAEAAQQAAAMAFTTGAAAPKPGV